MQYDSDPHATFSSGSLRECVKNPTAMNVDV